VLTEPIGCMYPPAGHHETLWGTIDGAWEASAPPRRHCQIGA
jgi:hypothetical protein